MKRTDLESLDRRRFLTLAGSAAASVVGASVLTRKGWARSAAVVSENAVPIRTHEHFGDIEEQLVFPADWNVQVQHMKGHGRKGLTPAQIREKLDHPIGTAPLREIAAGKKTAVITFDDLSRPTPIQAVLRMLVDDLRAAGLRDQNILFVTSFGTHRPMTHAEARAKLGSWVVENFAWVNHNVWHNLVDVGTTSRGNRIKLNHHFAKADLRITVSGIKGHLRAGYGGGAKAVLPGVAWMDSIAYFHSTIAPSNPSAGLGKVVHNEVRLDMEEAARLADVQFSVQVVYSEHREPVEIFAGDIVTAHRAACRMANGYLRTPAARDADIVVVNAYPQNRQAQNSLSWARLSTRAGGSVVLIAQHPDAISTMHYLKEFLPRRPHWEHVESLGKPVQQASQLIVFSQYMQKRDVDLISAKHLRLVRSWDDAMALCRKQHGSSARVAVYPYAGLQHPDVPLT